MPYSSLIFCVKKIRMAISRDGKELLEVCWFQNNRIFKGFWYCENNWILRFLMSGFLDFYCIFGDVSGTKSQSITKVSSRCVSQVVICISLSSASCWIVGLHCWPQSQTMAKLIHQQQCCQQYILWLAVNTHSIYCKANSATKKRYQINYCISKVFSCFKIDIFGRK